jgi:hypothetical protein
VLRCEESLALIDALVRECRNLRMHAVLRAEEHMAQSER